MEKKKPEIRFNGFEGEWETTTLGACSKKIITKNNGNEYNIVLTNSAERGIVDQRSYFDREIVNTENIQGYYIVSQDDFVYNPRISMQAPVGPINRSKIEYTGVMSPLYYVFRITDKRFNLTYLEWFFKSSSWHDFMYKNGNSGARSDRFSINDDVFLKLPIYHSKDISEQEKIGVFLTTLDNLIVKLEAKLDKLRKLKQALLEKMFTNINRGNEIPEIRFKGFEGEWATTTLGECFLERIERSAEGELISVTISQGVVRASDLDRIDNSSNDKSNYKVVEVGDIAYNSMRMWQGACGYSLYKGICSPAYTVVIPQNNIDVVYCFYLFKRNETLQLFRVNSQGLTSDTWNLKYPAFSQIKCSFPPLSEQRQIGKYFTQIDTHFSKTSTKLTKLRNIKQSLLQKMFA